MTLDILIPQYKETDDILRPLLDSIKLQQNVDFNSIKVIICNDGSDVYLTEDFLNSYPFRVEYYKESHKGVSATRNSCLDHSTADYVMFCDADDMFCNMCGLWIVFQQMEIGFDTLVSTFIEETKVFETGQPIYINREVDSTFVHGKIHRRQYLIDKNIRFNPNLTIHEDSYFNILAQNCVDDPEQAKFCPTPFYLWKWRDDSVCRHDPKYILKTYRNMLDSNDALIDEFIKRARQDKVNLFVAMMIYDTYYTFNKPEWINQENKEYRHLTEIRFKKYFLKFRDVWENIPYQDKMMISNSIRQRTIQEGMMMEAITLEQWLKYIVELED